MSDVPRRGRPVSVRSRSAALAAAVEVLEERGWGGFTVDEVARRSGVSKATLYAHWSGGFELAVAAYGETVAGAVPVRPTGDAPVDLRDQMLRLGWFYAGLRGRVAVQLIGAAAARDGGGVLLRERFFGERRADIHALIEQGQRAGQLRDDVAADLVVDLLFGPIVFRLLNGERPLTRRQIAALADVALPALAPP